MAPRHTRGLRPRSTEASSPAECGKHSPERRRKLGSVLEEFTSERTGGWESPPKRKNEAPGACAPRAEWTRLQPIRTAAEIPLEFALFTSEPFEFQRIGTEAARMRRLGMSLRAIGREFGVDEKTVRKALAQAKDSSP